MSALPLLDAVEFQVARIQQDPLCYLYLFPNFRGLLVMPMEQDDAHCSLWSVQALTWIGAGFPPDAMFQEGPGPLHDLTVPQVSGVLVDIRNLRPPTIEIHVVARPPGDD